MSNKIQVMNQAFGMQAVRQFVYSSAIGSLTAANAISPAVNFPNYGGLVGKPNNQDDPDATSAIGNPVWGNLTINAGSYTDLATGNFVQYPAMRIDTIIMTMTQAENVTLTTIQGRPGEVIEYVGRASWRINFKGGFFSTGNSRPIADIQAFKKIILSNAPISVTSSFLNDWDVSEIVCLDKTITQISGGYNYQLFEFNAIESTPVVLAQRMAL